MRQPDKEKGGPIDNPTGDPMPEPSIFTDGNNYANYFVRELYLGFNWEDFSKQYDGLYLYCGGRHMNKAIYGDDGPYNAEVYCNIVSGTENDYDIDFRDMSAEPKSNQHAKITGTFVNTCNTICLNYCEGFVRIKDNNHDTIPEAERRQLLCDFKYNAVMRVKGKSNDPTAPTKNDIAYKEGYVYDVAIFNSGFANILNNFISEKINANSKN